MRNISHKIRISVLIILTAAFCVLTVLTINGSLAVFENGVYTYLSQFIRPVVTSVAVAVTDCGSAVAVLTVALALLLLPASRMKLGVPIAVSVVLSGALNTVLKLLIARPRPDILRLVAETGFGFPSGHAMNSAALYTMVILLTFSLKKCIKIRLLVLLCGAAMAFLIGVSRVYLGVHNACDVLAGWIMGVTVALLVDMVYAIFQNKILNKGG